MFGIGMPELMVIAVIALLVVGPKRLPDLAKSFGKGLSEFRKATEGATETIKTSLHLDDLQKDMNTVKESILHGGQDDTVKHSASPPPEGRQESSPPNASQHSS